MSQVLERPKTVRLKPDQTSSHGGGEFYDYNLPNSARALGCPLTQEQSAAASVILNELYQNAYDYRRTSSELPHAVLVREGNEDRPVLSLRISDTYSNGLISSFLKSGSALGPLANLEFRTGRGEYPLDRKRLLMNLMLTPVGRRPDFLQAALALGADVKVQSEDMSWEASFSNPYIPHE